MSRARVLRAVLPGLMVLAVLQARPADASWYAGNKRSSSYGASASIRTTPSQPYLETSGESSWVSKCNCGGWRQAGWRYYKGWASARTYDEYNTNGGSYAIRERGNQSWNTYIAYKVDYVATSTWAAYIGGTHYGSVGPIDPAPAQVQAMAEVHVSSNNALDSYFSSVKYKNSSSTWVLFDQSLWQQDSPYKCTTTYKYSYRSYK